MEIEGVGELTFDVTTPCDGAALRRNVEHALSLGLPDIERYPSCGRRLSIIANGPTAKDAPLGGHTLAVNGAGKLFTRAGKAPSFWAACDPQEMVADFFDDPPEETVYLIGSKCHPSVFEALKDRRVILWHLGDEGGYEDLVADKPHIWRGPTITLCAFDLADWLGYEGLDLYGWDGCFYGKQHHAIDQDNGKRQIITLGVGTTTFPTTMTWFYEMDFAVRYLRQTRRSIYVHGNGMFGAQLRFQGLHDPDPVVWAEPGFEVRREGERFYTQDAA